MQTSRVLNPVSNLLRVIGSLVGGEDSVTDGSPMALTVGHSIIEQEDGTQKGKTICLSSMEWYEVGKCYAAPLHARQLLIAELTSIQKSLALALHLLKAGLLALRKKIYVASAYGVFDVLKFPIPLHSRNLDMEMYLEFLKLASRALYSRGRRDVKKLCESAPVTLFLFFRSNL
jgi:hypothetical protein